MVERWTMHFGKWQDLEFTQQFDHVITDPPYDDNVHNNMRSVNTTTRIISKGIDAGFSPLKDFDHVLPLISLSKRWIIFFCALEHLGDYKNASPSTWIRSGIYHKQRAVPQLSGDRPGNSCEGWSVHHPKGKKRWNGGGKHAFLEAMPENRDGMYPHKTKKPLKLMLQVIGLFTDPGDTVFDPYAGSGTTGAACLMTGRKFVGVEENAEHYETCLRRFKDIEGSPMLPFQESMRTYR